VREARCRDIKLLFLNLVNEFDAGDRDRRMTEALEPQYRSYALFHTTMVLLNHVVQIAVRPHKKFYGQDALFLEFAYRYMRGGIPSSVIF
jgi:hypothetical protein